MGLCEVLCERAKSAETQPRGMQGQAGALWLPGEHEHPQSRPKEGTTCLSSQCTSAPSCPCHGSADASASQSGGRGYLPSPAIRCHLLLSPAILCCLLPSPAIPCRPLSPLVPCPHGAFALKAILHPGSRLLWRAAWSREQRAGLNGVYKSRRESRSVLISSPASHSRVSLEASCL